MWAHRTDTEDRKMNRMKARKKKDRHLHTFHLPYKFLFQGIQHNSNLPPSDYCLLLKNIYGKTCEKSISTKEKKMKSTVKVYFYRQKKIPHLYRKTNHFVYYFSTFFSICLVGENERQKRVCFVFLSYFFFSPFFFF